MPTKSSKKDGFWGRKSHGVVSKYSQSTALFKLIVILDIIATFVTIFFIIIKEVNIFFL